MTKPIKVTVGIPAGWWLYTEWVRWVLSWVAAERTFEIAVVFGTNNTKCIGYSEIIEAARNDPDTDYLWILETNHLVQISAEQVKDLCTHFHCLATAPHYPGPENDGKGVIRAWPVHYDCVTEMPPTDQPFEIATASTAFVSIDRETFKKMVPRFYWDLNDYRGSEAQHIPIYCYDGDVVTIQGKSDPEPVDLAASLFHAIQETGAGTWAFSALKTQNLRLAGTPSYR